MVALQVIRWRNHHQWEINLQVPLFLEILDDIEQTIRQSPHLTLPSTPVTSTAEHISLYSIYIFIVLYIMHNIRNIRIESVSSSLTLISLLPQFPLKRRNLDAAIRAGPWSSDRWLSRGRCVAPEHNGEQDIAGRTSEDGKTTARRAHPEERVPVASPALLERSGPGPATPVREGLFACFRFSRLPSTDGAGAMEDGKPHRTGFFKGRL